MSQSANRVELSGNPGKHEQWFRAQEGSALGVSRGWVQDAIRKTTMSKFTVAAMLTLPLLALGQQRAAADGWGLFSWAHKGDGSCATCNQGAPNPGYPANYAGYPAANPGCATCGLKGGLGCGKGGCGPLGCGLGCTPFGCFPVTLGIKGFLNSPPPWAHCGAGKNDCCGKVPGPWYLYWPDPRGVGVQTGPAYPGWTYESNFTGSVMGFNAAGTYPQYPSYWYGR